MANAKAFDHAVSEALSLQVRQPDFSVGCHVVLLDGEPLAPAAQVSSLLSADSTAEHPQFRTTIGSFTRSALTGKLVPEEIEAEADAQFGRIQEKGITLSHFDCHKHAHMFPAVLKPLLKVAGRRGVRAVRNPYGALIPLPFHKMARHPKLWRRAAELGVLRSFAGGFRREVARSGLRTPDGTVGVLVTGELDHDSFVELMRGLPEGTWEFVCHPGYHDADLDQVRTRLRESRQQELALLTSPDIGNTLEDCGIELISYHEL